MGGSEGAKRANAGAAQKSQVGKRALLLLVTSLTSSRTTGWVKTARCMGMTFGESEKETNGDKPLQGCQSNGHIGLVSGDRIALVMAASAIFRGSKPSGRPSIDASPFIVIARGTDGRRAADGWMVQPHASSRFGNQSMLISGACFR